MTDRPKFDASLPGPADPRHELKRVRLNRYLALVGVASRRAADRLIADRRVRVNGLTVEELGTLVLPGRDQVLVDGVLVGPVEVPRYFMLHKPRGVVTTAADPQGRPTVLDLVGGRAGIARVFPVGRLDMDTSGLLILTNDTEFGEALLRPESKVPKTYYVKVSGVLTSDDYFQLAFGVEIGRGESSGRAIVRETRATDKYTWLELTITEGKNRQVRRMCDAIGHPVLKLVRIRIGNFELGDLQSCKFRRLGPADLKKLVRIRHE